MLCNRPNPQALGAGMHHEHDLLVLQRLNGRALFGEDWPCQLPIIGGPDLFPAQWWRELLLSPCADRGVVAEGEAFLSQGGKRLTGGLQGRGLRIIAGVVAKG